MTIHIQLYKTRRFTGHEKIDLQVGPVIVGLVIAIDCQPKLHVKLAGIPFCLRLNSFSASFPGGQRVVSSGPSGCGRSAREGPRKSPVCGRFAFLYLCGLRGFVAL